MEQTNCRKNGIGSSIKEGLTIEVIFFRVNCEGQKEIDYYWEELSAFPKNQQGGWLIDKFGVSWQDEEVHILIARESI